MRHTSRNTRILALLLALVLCLSALPWTAFASDSSATWTKVELSDIQASDTIAITMSKDGTNWVLPNTGEGKNGQPLASYTGAIEGTRLTTDQSARYGWTVKAVEGGYTIQNAAGEYLYLTATNNGMRIGGTAGVWTVAEGYLASTDSKDAVRYLGVYNSQDWRCYTNTTGNTAGQTLGFWKLEGGAVQPEPTEPTAPSEPVPTEPAVTVSTVAEAKAMASGTENIAVSGTVVFVNGKNVAVQDATGGINLYFSAAPEGIALGDVIQATGKRGAYNGLEQLTGVQEFTKTGTAELPAKEVTIAEILADQDTAALESTRVVIKGAVIGEINTSGNTPLTQGEASINIYQLPALEGVAAGDTVDLFAVVSDFKGYQLRVNSAADVTKVTTPETPAEPWKDVDTKYAVYELVDAPADGDVVVLYNPGNAKALSSEDAGYYKAGVEAAVAGETYIASDSKLIPWTVAVDAEGVYTFTQGELKLGIEASGKYFNLKTNAGDYGFKTEPIGENGQSCIYSATQEGTYGHVYLEWYASKSAFSAYCTGADKVTEDVFGFKFYKLVREAVEPEQPEEPEEPVSGALWTKVELSDIQAADTIAITMSKDGVNWVLPTKAEGSKGQPLATYTGTVAEDKLTTDQSALYGWTITAVEGGYTIQNAAGEYLYLTATNNGMRIGGTVGVWTVAEGYLASTDSKDALRYLGVYEATDWRCYTNTTGNTAGQTLGFWKLDAAGEPDQPEEPAVPVIADGQYVLWVGGEYNKALSSVYPEGSYYNSGVSVTLADGKLSGYGETEIWTITNNEDGTIAISIGGQNLGMGASYSSMSLGAVNDTWTLEAASDGRCYVKNVGREQYIQWRAGESYNYFSGYYLSENDNFAINFTPAEAVETPAATVADGDYVIWAPAYGKALSTVYGGYYNNGVNVSEVEGVLTGYESTEIWTVTNNTDGTITLSCADGKLAMDTGYSSMPLNKVNDTWTLEDAGNGLWYVKNVGRGCYVEWFDANSYWSGYAYINAGTEGMFALKFTPVTKGYETADLVDDIAQWGGMTVESNTDKVYGDKYVVGDEQDTAAIFTSVVNGAAGKPWIKGGNSDAPLYYMGGTGLGSGSNDYLQLQLSAAGWADMTLAFRLRASNTAAGAFTLQYSVDGVNFKNFTTGSYAYAYTKYTSDGSTPVTGEGSITDGIAKTSLAPTYYVSFAFDVPAGADNAETLYIRLVPGTAKANGSDGAISATSTLRMDSVVLSGSPILSEGITGYVDVTPNGVDEDVPAGTELTMTTETEDATIYYSINGGAFRVYNPEAKPVLETLPSNVEVYASVDGKADSVKRIYRYAAGTVANVQFTPTESNLYLAEDETVTITMSSATAGAAIYYSLDGGETWTVYDAAAADEALTLTKGFGELTIQAYASYEGFKDSAIVTREYTERASERFGIYFGQLHSHTNISDGSGSITEAYAHAAAVENLDFLAVTDHSNSFDGEGSGVISENGAQISTEWATAQAAADAATTGDFVGLYGYEMTWSNGLGHMNTFNTPGWQSRTQADYKTQSTALQNYYAALATVPGSISQFNHPGTTFGDFSDFAHYSEETDALITLIEVGNGEGAIGSAGYFPSYEYYTRALDKGWHVAPTNNQDNHKGLWGDANTGRSVVLAGSLSKADIYDALRNYRVYATEDNDLNIYYTLNGNIMGSILNKSDVGETLALSVDISDATDASVGRVEVIVNGGLSIAAQTVTENSQVVEFSVPSAYSYYYIKITQPDGDIAVTAPVWVGKVEAVGITSFTTDAPLAVQNQEMELTLDLFNNEKKDLVIESIVFTIGEEVIHTAEGLAKVDKMGTASYAFPFTYAGLGQVEIEATVTATLDGVTKIYKEKLSLSFATPDMVTRVVVDGTHLNDYVTGYYQGNINNLPVIAAESQIEVNVVTDEITAETLANCDLLIISAPAKKDKDHYVATLFSDSFIALVADYVKAGGSVIVCGLADYQDKGAPSADYHTAAQLNKLLAAIGSTMTINDDEVYDEVNNGGQAYRLYPENFNPDSPWTAGIKEGQVYSQYSGCTVNVGSGTWLVKGFDTTYAIDSDGDGIGGIEMGEAVFLAVEETPYGGNIFAAGGVFVSDFEVKAELDNIWDLPYANRTIIENILAAVQVELPLSTIAEARQGELDQVFRIQGYLTAGTDNEYNKFFDAIYVQDDTAGITVFPFAEAGVAVGTPIEITGYIDEYQGDKEIQIISYKLLDTEPKVYAPQKMNNKDAMDYAANGGKLIQVEGEVVAVNQTASRSAGSVAEFTLKDENGDLAKVFIDGYILSGTTGENTLGSIVKVGNTVSAVGLLYMHPEGASDTSVAVLRVRNCDEVKLVKEAASEPTEEPTDPTEETTEPTTEPTEKPTTEPTTKPTTKPTGGNAGTGDPSLVVYGLGLMALTMACLGLLLANRKKWLAK